MVTESRLSLDEMSVYIEISRNDISRPVKFGKLIRVRFLIEELRPKIGNREKNHGKHGKYPKKLGKH